MTNRGVINTLNSLLNLDEDSTNRDDVMERGFELLRILDDGMIGDDSDKNIYLIIKLDKDE